MLQVEKVGSVTRPVTQVAVVAVKRASRYGTATPSAELTGRASRRLPSRIMPRKLSMMIWVVVRRNAFFTGHSPLSWKIGRSQAFSICATISASLSHSRWASAQSPDSRSRWMRVSKSFFWSSSSR